jgi:hypothetical protein
MCSIGLAGQAAIQARRNLLKQQCLSLAIAAPGKNVSAPVLAGSDKAMSRTRACHRRAKDLVKRIHLAARLAHLSRKVEQLLLLPHLALRFSVTLEPTQRDCSLLCDRKRRALVARPKAPSKTQAGMQLIIHEHGNA